MSDAKPEFNVQQSKFIDAYTKPNSKTQGNATQSAIVAGYSEHTANEQGARLLANVSILAAINKRLNRLSERAEMDAVGALKLLVGQARADPRELSEYVIDSCRHCWGEGNLYQRTFVEMANEREKFEEKLNGLLDSTDPKDHEKAKRMGDFDLKGGIGFDPRKGPNPECMVCFGRGVGKTIFKDTRNLSDEAVILYAGTQTTKDGTKILQNSQDSARANLAKHFGLLKDLVETKDTTWTDEQCMTGLTTVLERIAADVKAAKLAEKAE